MENSNGTIKVGDVFTLSRRSNKRYTIKSFARESGSWCIITSPEDPVYKLATWENWLATGVIVRVYEAPTRVVEDLNRNDVASIQCALAVLDKAVLALRAADSYLFGTRVGVVAKVRIDRAFLTSDDLATLVVRLQDQLRQALVNSSSNR